MNTEEEFGLTDEEEFDMFMNFLKEESEKPRKYILNPERLLEMKTAYNLLADIVKKISQDARITASMHEANVGAGVITIETDELIVDNVNKFIQSIKIK